MFNENYRNVKPYPKGAHEIAMEARAREKELAQLNAQLKAEFTPRSRNSINNPIVRLITSLFGL